jgi:hypothetical protein
MHAVLLCAEDDDLELVELVHLGRQAGIELEVMPGVEADDGVLVESLTRCDASLFVVLRSYNLSSARALELKTVFETHRTDAQHLLALRLNQNRTDHALNIIERRLKQIGDEDQPCLPPYETLPTGPYPVVPRTETPVAERTPIPVRVEKAVEDAALREQDEAVKSPSRAGVGS